jgi:predicted kinase
MEAVIFIGVQGAGKTSFYRNRFFDTHLRVSLDMLHSRRREELLIKACLEGGQRFVLDNTNILVRGRARYIEPARRAGFRVIGYHFLVPLEDAIRRNNQRTLKQKIPVSAVVSTFKRLEPPKLDEGFDAIYTVEVNPDGQFTVSLGDTNEQSLP